MNLRASFLVVLAIGGSLTAVAACEAVDAPGPVAASSAAAVGSVSQPVSAPTDPVPAGGLVMTTPGSLPAMRTCVHRQPDGTCITPTGDDADADGFVVGRDCDDHDPYTYPGAQEILCDNVDEDCDGADFCPPDADHDGFSPPGDCDDHDPRRNRLATETFCNGIDEDCDGLDACDADGDGESVPGDCNDHDTSVSPHAKEVMCDGIDQDCDGADCCDNDTDGDGTACQHDCDDHDSAAYPGAPVPDGCYWKDMNCDGILDGSCGH